MFTATVHKNVIEAAVIPQGALMGLNQEKYREILACYPTGISLITGMNEDNEPIGIVVGSFTSISLDPPLVGFFIGKQSTSWPKIDHGKGFCVSFITEELSSGLEHFLSNKEDRFAQLKLSQSPGGIPVVDGAAAWIECEKLESIEIGDHLLVTGKPVAASIPRDHAPLVFHSRKFKTTGNRAN